MTLETSRKILKISGILGIICAVFAIIAALAIFGVGVSPRQTQMCRRLKAPPKGSPGCWPQGSSRSCPASSP